MYRTHLPGVKAHWEKTQRPEVMACQGLCLRVPRLSLLQLACPHSPGEDPTCGTWLRFLGGTVVGS